MSMWRPGVCRGPCCGPCGGGLPGGVVVVTTTGSGNRTGPSSQPTGPRKHDKAMRSTSVTVNSRPSTRVPIIGDTAAQPTAPKATQPNVGMGWVAGGGGVGATQKLEMHCACDGVSEPMNSAISNLSLIHISEPRDRQK